MVNDGDQSAKLEIRPPQMVAMVDALKPEVVIRAVAAMTTKFPDGVHGVAVDGYDAAIRALALRLAERYGIVAPRDLLRMIGLVVMRGWQLDVGPDGAWVRAILEDARIASPTRRVDRLLAESRRRATIEARNAAIQAQLDGGRRSPS